MSIYKSAVKKPVTTTLIFIAFAVLGIFSLINSSIAQLPEFESNTIMVMASYPGANARDIENNLTKVLENSLNGVEDLKELTSQSKEGVSLLTVTFNYGTDLDEATNNVRDKLSMVASALPDGVSTPTIFKFSAADLPIMMLSARAQQSSNGLDKILDDKLATPLARVSGVGTISINGAPTREIKVYCDPNKLQAYGLSISTISQMISAENRNIPTGNIDIGSETYTLRVQKEFSDPSEMLDIVVGSSNGKIVYLRDVAEVIDGPQEREQEAYTNGSRSANIVIQKQTGANTVNVIKDIKEKLKDIEEDLPEDIELSIINDGSTEIINTIKSLFETILITFLVVMLVVFLFLGNFKSTIIIILSIPIALLASLVYLYATGNTLNIISMSSLAIAIGMVVDDAIVVLENVTTHIQRGEKPKEAAIYATSEVAISVIASTLTMLCVFIPLTMISGMAGLMFKQLGWIVSIIMIVSTTAALSFVPMLCAYWLKRDTGKHNIIYKTLYLPFNRFINWISRGYAHIIHWATKRRKIVVFIFIAIFVGAMLLLVPNLKTEFFPRGDSNRISATIELPMGTAQEVTREFAFKLYEDIHADVPEAKIISMNFGQADSDNIFANMQNNGTHIISYNINIGTSSTRERTSSQIADIVRADAAKYPEIRRARITEGGGGMGGASSVEVEVYGYSFEDTDLIAKQIQNQMQKAPEFAQVAISRDEYVPELQMDFDRTKLALNGLSSTTAGAAFSAAMSGSVASYYREEGEEYVIRVRYAPEFRTSVEDLGNILITNAYGKQVRMKDLGTIVETSVPPTIERKDRERLITVTGILGEKVALNDAVASVENILGGIDMPAGISTEIGGDIEEQTEMFSDLIVLMLLIIILVYMVMASQFESYGGPFVIMFSVPFALVGVLLGLNVTGYSLGAMAMVGIIILLGIVVKNGIVLIDYTILCQERGMSIRDAVTTAAKSRLRPILMTTLTTVLGMVPLAIGTGEGSEMWHGLGVTVVWGLSFSTLVTLVLIPTLYCSVAYRMDKKKNKKK